MEIGQHGFLLEFDKEDFDSSEIKSTIMSVNKRMTQDIKIKYIKRNLIDIPKVRIRTFTGKDVSKLVESIKKIGILHPILYSISLELFIKSYYFKTQIFYFS